MILIDLNWPLLTIFDEVMDKKSLSYARKQFASLLSAKRISSCTEFHFYSKKKKNDLFSRNSTCELNLVKKYFETLVFTLCLKTWDIKLQKNSKLFKFDHQAKPPERGPANQSGLKNGYLGQWCVLVQRAVAKYA